MHLAQHIKPESLLTSHEAGSLLQVNPSSINNWVRSGHITAFRTPGGHLRIRAHDLVQFLARHKMPIPYRLEGAFRKRLLIVDDDVRQLGSWRRTLRPYAGRIDVALLDNGIDALVQVGIFRPHAILLDVFMPGLDGLSVCRRLRAMPETKDIAIVVMSGHLTHDLEKQATKIGVRRCIEKPIKLDAILEELDVGAEGLAGTR
jgi:excisionase family DNA binding protein